MNKPSPIVQRDPNRPRTLAAQPSRKWDDDEVKKPATTSTSSTTLVAPSRTALSRTLSKDSDEMKSDDWPPSPPRPRSTAAAAAAAVASKSSNMMSTAALFGNRLPSALVPPKPQSQQQRASQTSHRQLSSSSQSATNAFNLPTRPDKLADPKRSTATAPEKKPEKRRLPWDDAARGALPKKQASSANVLAGLLNAEASTSKSREPTPAPVVKGPPKKFLLSKEQQEVHDLVVNKGQSVFFTGSAGTGKSVLLRQIIESLRRKYAGRDDAVAVTASTGMAACNIGGTTIHSFAGIGLGNEPADKLLAKVRRSHKAAGKWTRAKVLVIDEVSMLDGVLFDKLAYIASQLNKKRGNLPFGGIQLIVTGDFFQLPPVVKGGGDPKFAFDAAEWRKTIQHTINLTQVFRQTDDKLVRMLNELRFGDVSQESVRAWRALEREPVGHEPTELFPLRTEVEAANNMRLKELPGPSQIYKAEDWEPEQNTQYGPRKNTYLENFMAPKYLELKVGARVMLLKNLSDTLVNGSVGEVIDFVDERYAELAEEYLSDPEERALVEHMKKASKKTASAAGGQLMPRIRFDLPNNMGTEITVIKKAKFEVEGKKNEVLARRTTVPLILAWAMSIHKSQGQTLPYVKVDLKKIFERGQTYVALSRAVNIDGLQVLNFDHRKAQCHDRVRDWSRDLRTLA